jgi:biopolymer transport protein ExbD
VVVSVARDGAVSVGKEAVARDALAAIVKTRLGQSNGIVQLRGDKDAAYGDVVAIMDELAANGVTRIAIVSSGRRPASASTQPAPAQ